MAIIIKIGTGWVNLDTVAGATTQEGTGVIGLRFAGSTEFAYLDARDSAIMREVLDTLAINAHDVPGGVSGAATPTAGVDMGEPGSFARPVFDRSRPPRGYNRDE